MTTGPVVGVIGGGQLARMMQPAAVGLGVQLRVVAHPGDEAAPAVVPDTRTARLDDLPALRRALDGVDVVTFDHERLDPALVERLEAAGHVVRPGAATLRRAADKGAQRHLLRHAGLPVPAFVVTTEADEIRAFGDQHDWPLAAKAVRGGYDGRGVWQLTTPADAEQVLAEVGHRPLLVEPWLTLERELAVLVVRGADGATTTYPVFETRQHDGICHAVVAPAAVPDTLADQARALAVAVADEVDVIGVLAVELFVHHGRLVVNELAPRPHNSGHLTIDACATSQFENHLRAVLGWPLGATHLLTPAAAMVNVLADATGADPRVGAARALADPDVRLHLYGKGPRPGRKVGHVTVRAASAGEALTRAHEAATALGAAAPVLGRVA